MSGSAKRLGLTALAVALAAGGFAQSASAALFFVFKPTTARPGERVAVRTPWTPAGFSYRRAKRPLRPAVRLYLVRNAVANEISYRRDPRLVPFGRIRLDGRIRGAKRFVVPDVAPGVYTLAYWCSYCRPKQFASFRVDENVVPRYRHQMTLTVRAPSHRDKVVRALRDRGLEMAPAGTNDVTFDSFDVTGELFTNSGGGIDIWEFVDEAQLDAVEISSDGRGFSWRPRPDQWVSMSILFVGGPPHWFRSGRVLALSGGNDLILDALRTLLGPQVAGG